MTRALAVVATLAACYTEPPRPAATAVDLRESVAIPADHDLAIEIEEAVAKKRLADFDRALDAKEPGEQLEHSTLSQVALDREVFTLDDMFRVADDLFAYTFRPEQGLGNALSGRAGIPAGSSGPPNLRRVHQSTFGGPDAMACADCHSVGGDDGAGTLTQNALFRGDGDRVSSADVRNAPALLGIGPIAALATEMTSELTAQRAAALAAASSTMTPVTAPLVAKGLAFGTLVANPDGSVDTSSVTGVSPDLVVRPFGWKGHSATLRDIIKESFRIHLGILAMADQQAIRDGRISPAAFGDGPWFDADRDGVTIEVEDGMVTTMVAYLSQLEVPIAQPPTDPALLDRFARGRAVFDAVGCGGCHVPSLQLIDPVVETRAEQTENAASPVVVIDVSRDGLLPKIDPVDLQRSAYEVRLFSDLRRHDLGPGLAAPADQDGIAVQQWLTRPLWGLADTAPYLHDGRAPTIDDAIRAHGGEADAVRGRYVAASDGDRSALLLYLTSLARTRRVFIP